MNLAIISLSALILALALSSISAINVGFLAIVLAWVVGVYAGSMTVDQVIAGFPVSLRSWNCRPIDRDWQRTTRVGACLTISSCRPSSRRT